MAGGSISCRYVRRSNLLRTTNPFSFFSHLLRCLIIFCDYPGYLLGSRFVLIWVAFAPFLLPPFPSLFFLLPLVVPHLFCLSCCSLLLLFSELSLSSLSLYQIRRRCVGRPISFCLSHSLLSLSAYSAYLS